MTMADKRTEKQPTTFLEALFHAVDTVARRLVNYMPLSRGIRSTWRATPQGLIGWDHVSEIAVATLELQREQPDPISPDMVERYQGMMQAAQEQVATFTGLFAQGLPQNVMVFDQRDWIEANVVSFRFLFDPISEKYMSMIEELGPGQGAAANRFAYTLLSIQIGIIMGYMARNVLGQFDLSLPEPEKGGKLYVVEPNVRRIEQQMGLEPHEFRQWITLHEVTHSYEFHCNNWLRDHLASSMQQYLRTIDWRGLSRPDIMRNMRAGRVSRDDAMQAGGLISIISTPEQREIMARLQGIMCVLEGYSNHVMDGVGEQLLSTYDTMKVRFERRREMKSGAERLFQRLIGLDLKLEQYRLGQQFVDAVAKSEGLPFLNQVWEGPDKMPTMEEVRDPSRWIERIKSGKPTLRLV